MTICPLFVFLPLINRTAEIRGGEIRPSPHFFPTDPPSTFRKDLIREGKTYKVTVPSYVWNGRNKGGESWRTRRVVEGTENLIENLEIRGANWEGEKGRLSHTDINLGGSTL